MFDWNLIRSFLAILDEGSLAAASRRTGISQPTLGRHVDELEASLGVTLFRRGRSGMVAAPADFPWSSHAHYVGLRQEAWLAPDALYWAMGNTPFAREQAYAKLVQGAPGSRPQAELAKAVHSRSALGNSAFIADLEEVARRPVAVRRPGRPRRTAFSADG